MHRGQRCGSLAIEVFNRSEIKYLLTDDVYRKIRPILEDYMEVDAYSRNGEFYTICNIYYDTDRHDLIRKSIDKPAYKEKLRLRSYGVVRPGDKVYLEIKKKFDGKVNKRRTSMRLEEAYRYMLTREKPAPKSYMSHQVFREIDQLMNRYPLKPKLYLSYDRNAYFGKEDNGFRVTFDTNILTRREDLGLDIGIYGESLLPEGLWIMEAKAENALPLWFARLLSTYRIYPASFSKYGSEYQKTILQKELPKIDLNNIILKEEMYDV